jgi:hypothetical protein
VLLVHAGNRIDLPSRSEPRFPSARVPAVRELIGRVLDALRPTAVVSAAAAGADLIVLEEAARRLLEVHVVMSIARDEFVSRSVADAGQEWVDRFNTVLGYVHGDSRCSVVQGVGNPGDSWYLAAHDELLRRAVEIAAGGTVVALTVRPPEDAGRPSATDDFVARATKLGLLVLSIDPRPKARSPVAVS